MPNYGRIIPVSFEVACRRCKESVEEPTSGSFVWTEDDLRRLEGSEYRCPNGHYVTIKAPRS